MITRRAPRAALALGLLLVVGTVGPPCVRAQDARSDSTVAEIPRPVGFVSDVAGVIDDAERARLEAFLVQVKQKTGVEFAVLTLRTTAPEPPESYKVRVFRSWNLGQDGLLMLVALEERRVVFETGYGVEGTLPDGLQSRIFRQQMRDRFRAGDFAGGIRAGVIDCARRIAAEKGVTLDWDGRELRYVGGKSAGPPIGLIFLIAVVVLVALSIGSGGGGGGSRRRGWRRDGWGGLGGMGGMGGWGGWGGGFGGGGGGGGFGGGGFGGFSGGSGGGFSSGGGGGGGSW